MATYKEIHGVNIQSRDSDATAVEGDVWYNASTSKLKMYAAVNAWATATNFPIDSTDAAGCGTQTAGLVVAGYNPGPNSGNAEESVSYDGSSWTDEGDINTGRRGGSAAGTTEAAIYAGGYSDSPQAVAETFDGSSWTEVGDLNNARALMGSSFQGTSTATIVIAGQPGNGTYQAAVVEKWNGTAWTEVGDVNTSRYRVAGVGTSTAALGIGGQTAPPTSKKTLVESWNGTAWTEIADLNAANSSFVGSGGSQTSAIVFGGGNPGNVATTEEWDGSSWAEKNDLNTARHAGTNPGGIGTAAAALAVTGNTPSNTPHGRPTSSYVEEWSLSQNVKTITD